MCACTEGSYVSKEVRSESRMGPGGRHSNHPGKMEKLASASMQVGPFSSTVPFMKKKQFFM